jgi:hypothetical protein
MVGRSLRTLLLALLVALTAPLASAQVYVAYQAIPGTNTGWPDIARLDYTARQALSEQVRREILPAVAQALDLQGLPLETQIVPGGYRLKTDPSFVTRFPQGEEAKALQFAAALGYVLRQDSMLVFAIDEQGGDSLTVRVAIDGECLSPQIAHRFFVQAARVEKGLGGGFTAFGCEMLFINLRDGRGVPFSGLNDDAFAAALVKAAAQFIPSSSIAGSFRTRTVLIGEGWPGSKGGALYTERLASLPVEAIAPLDLLSYRFGDWLRQAVR